MGPFKLEYSFGEYDATSIMTRFPSNPLIIRVPFFLIFGFNKGDPKPKRAKGYYLGT